jgi:hypothetical protein
MRSSGWRMDHVADGGSDCHKQLARPNSLPADVSSAITAHPSSTSTPTPTATSTPTRRAGSERDVSYMAGVAGRIIDKSSQLDSPQFNRI